MKSLIDRLESLEAYFVGRCAACRSLPSYVVRLDGIEPHTDPWGDLGSDTCKCGFEPTVVNYIVCVLT